MNKITDMFPPVDDHGLRIEQVERKLFELYTGDALGERIEREVTREVERQVLDERSTIIGEIEKGLEKTVEASIDAAMEEKDRDSDFVTNDELDKRLEEELEGLVNESDIDDRIEKAAPDVLAQYVSNHDVVRAAIESAFRQDTRNRAMRDDVNTALDAVMKSMNHADTAIDVAVTMKDTVMALRRLTFWQRLGWLLFGTIPKSVVMVEGNLRKAAQQ